MRSSSLFPSLLAALSLAAPSLAAGASSADSLKSTFKPPQVFKNTNLVHIISLEKNFVKETINLVVENIDKKPQSDYYLPFTSNQLSRVGGFEARYKKEGNNEAFKVEATEVDVKSDTQYYRIHLPTPLAAGSKETIAITYYYLSAYSPLPRLIAQDDKQYLAYTFSAYVSSAYTTTKQKTEVKFPSSSIPDYTKLPGSGDIKEFPQKAGSKLTYGPFDEKPAGAAEPITVRFEFTKPVLHASHLERDIEVSHWGGNVAFEERYTLYNRGANLSALFNRVKWAQSQYYSPTTSALKELRFPLRVGSADAYYTDVIGNISTSRFRSNDREAMLEIKPRYPVFGGWKFPFTIGWNSDAKNYLRKATGGGYVLNVPLLEGPKVPEGIEYELAQIRVILPEGAENVKFYTTVPASAITETTVDVQKTFLDTVGRTTLTIKARNLVDDFRGRDLIISYDYSLMASLRKPLIIFTSLVGFFATVWAVGNVEFKFTK